MCFWFFELSHQQNNSNLFKGIIRKRKRQCKISLLSLYIIYIPGLKFNEFLSLFPTKF